MSRKLISPFREFDPFSSRLNGTGSTMASVPPHFRLQVYDRSFN
jgi:hypothetical protein